MRVTVCELPHEPVALAAAWRALCEHARRERSDLVLLPEFAFVAPVWNDERFDAATWQAAVQATESWLDHLPELGVAHVIGARPVTDGGTAYNEGFLWSRNGGSMRLRRKYWLPDEAGGWEARWFARGDRDFAPFRVGDMAGALNICTELWALDTYAPYAALGVDAVFSPRATAAATTHKWLSIGTVAAVRTGAYSVSSNRVHADGSCGGVGWVIGPDGERLASTSAAAPFCTVALDLRATAAARSTYPRYVFVPRG
jgi:N-carbamoylputrescine amidase